MSAEAAIETDRLTKRYGSARGIDSVSLCVNRGEVFGFLGPNGAGKTTTIRTLLDLQRPTSGRARILGLDCQRDSRRVRARIGNLPGDFAYDPHLRGGELLALLSRLRGGVPLEAAWRLARRFDADLGRPLGQLSRGNRQKVGLIQALFHDPELVILDEPTGGLDPLVQEEFLAVVGELRDRGQTVFLSSHELDAVQRVCDRVGIIAGGQLVAVGAVEELTRRAPRRISVEFAAPVDATEFRAIAGVRDVQAHGRHVRLQAAGDLDAVVKAIAGHEIADIEISPPTLEEVFVTSLREGASP